MGNYLRLGMYFKEVHVELIVFPPSLEIKDFFLLLKVLSSIFMVFYFLFIKFTYVGICLILILNFLKSTNIKESFPKLDKIQKITKRQYFEIKYSNKLQSFSRKIFFRPLK